MVTPIPDVIEATTKPEGSSEPHGIIYKIKQLRTDILSYVYPSTNVENVYGNISTIVNWDGYWSNYASEDAYLQIEFKGRFVNPTYYSIRGYGDNYHWCYSKEWYLHGYKTLEENESPVLLSIGETTTEYCGSNNGCLSGGWASYPIKKTRIFFRYLRITIKEPSCDVWHLLFSGIEIFGTYSIAATKMKCITNHKCSLVSLYSVLLDALLLS